MKNIKRRFFIKSSSLVAGGLVLPSFNINRMANSSNNKKLKGESDINSISLSYLKAIRNHYFSPYIFYNKNNYL